MHVLLLQHSRENTLSYPLGLGYIAAVLIEAGHSVTFLDLALENGDATGLIDHTIKERGIEAVGMSAMTPTYPDALNVAKQLRKRHPGVPIVLGGHHASILPEEVLRGGGADVVGVGEGEVSAPLLFSTLETGGDLSSVAGIGYLDPNGVYIQTPSAPKVLALDDIPFPSWSIIRPERYEGRLRNRKSAILITSRGCPHRCAHCNRGPTGGLPVRLRSVANVMTEIKTLYKQYGIKAFRIKDDQLTLSREHAMEFCHALIREKLHIFWDCLARVDRVDSELIALMKRAGCVRVDFGVESGSQYILNKLGKKTTTSAIHRAFSICRKAGMPTRAYFIVGTPWETRKTIKATIRVAKALRATTAIFFLATPYPGTALRNAFIHGGWQLPPSYDQYLQYGKSATGKSLTTFPPPDHPLARFESQRLRATRVVALTQLLRIWDYPYLLSSCLRVYPLRKLCRRAVRGLGHIF